VGNATIAHSSLPELRKRTRRFDRWQAIPRAIVLALAADFFTMERRIGIRGPSMIDTATTNNPRRVRISIGRVCVRAMVAQLLLIFAAVSSPTLFRHAPELGEPVESSAPDYEFPCDRTGAPRIRNCPNSAPLERRVIAAKIITPSGNGTTRAVAPGWLAQDLPAPLLC
jgi:hypothetical protein